MGVVSAVGFSALFSFFVLMPFLFSIQDFDATIGSKYGQPVLQIFVDIAGEDGALVLFSLIMGKSINRRAEMVSILIFMTSNSLCLALRSFQHDQQQPYDVRVFS